ncbi:MAG: c-type cytochrome biogenesis protein CcmI [Roseibium sp.]
MILWILIAVLTAAAALSVLLPMARARQSTSNLDDTADEAVYREQLSAIDNELERGLIDVKDAEAARTETARRLLAAHEKKQQKAEVGSGRTRVRVAQGLAIVILPLIALVVYLALGSPDFQDQPLAARLNEPTDNQSVEVLVARVERHLAANPEDGQGWAIIAPVYMRQGQLQDAIRAFDNANRLLGPNPEWLTDMGEAMTMINGGVVTAEARQVFQQAVKLDPNAIKPRFLLAVSLGQEDKTDEAIKAWENLLEGADETETWVQVARRNLAELKGTPSGLPGPNAEEMAAAQEMSATDRQDMIRSMVEGLATRLEADGGSSDEWSRLLRAYMVLGEKDKAIAAFKLAESAFADNPDELARIKDAADKMGLIGS